MISNPAPNGAGADTTSRPSPELPATVIEEGAHRVGVLGAIVALFIVTGLLLHRVLQPQAAPIIDDPVNRLVTLAAVLTGVAVFALQRYAVVNGRTLLRVGLLFEGVVAFAIAMLETSQPFPTTVPLLGVSAIAPWLVLAGAVSPAKPAVRLAVAIAAATTWLLAYAINSIRFDFATHSWRQTVIWPAINYGWAYLAYLVGRWTYGTARSAEPAAELGSYRLIERIGEGGMGEVWRASHNMLARPAAVKLVKLDTSRQELLAKRFQREANAIAALQSPHSVYLYDFGITPQGRLYYVMELLDGISLQSLIATFGVQPPSRVVAILRQMCASLEEAHASGIVHRDLKPSNVMICQVGEVYDFVKVLDFGLAKPFNNPNAPQLTVQGVTTGTPEYMAPEVAAARDAIGPPADLYSVACVGYFLLTGSLVFEDSNPVAVALKHMRTPPVPPSRRSDQVIPPDLERVILLCLQKEPRARPASARALERMLTACEVPPWTDDEAAEWWARHLPPTSPLRSFARHEHAPSVV